jgi:hypothetical protein
MLVSFGELFKSIVSSSISRSSILRRSNILLRGNFYKIAHCFYCMDEITMILNCIAIHLTAADATVFLHLVSLVFSHDAQV